MDVSMLQFGLLFWGQIIIKFTLCVLGVYTMILAIKAFKIYINKNKDF